MGTQASASRCGLSSNTSLKWPSARPSFTQAYFYRVGCRHNLSDSLFSKQIREKGHVEDHTVMMKAAGLVQRESERMARPDRRADETMRPPPAPPSKRRGVASSEIKGTVMSTAKGSGQATKESAGQTESKLNHSSFRPRSSDRFGGGVLVFNGGIGNSTTRNHVLGLAENCRMLLNTSQKAKQPSLARTFLAGIESTKAAKSNPRFRSPGLFATHAPAVLCSKAIHCTEIRNDFVEAW